MKKKMTFEIDDDLAARVETIAKIHGIPIVESVRVALEDYVRTQLASDAFRAKLRATVEAQQQLLEEGR